MMIPEKNVHITYVIPRGYELRLPPVGLDPINLVVPYKVESTFNGGNSISVTTAALMLVNYHNIML